jgi:asparagine synthase (glutamine-hydrolysing)
LFLARDRFGKKPLYYSFLDDGTLVFASELKALMLHPRMPQKLLPQAIEDYMTFGYVPDPKTIFDGVLKLPPGHFLSIRRGATFAEPRRYWDVSFDLQDGHADETEIRSELLSRFSDATRRRLVSDVPLGAFLSGGVDSSAVVSAMAELSPGSVSTCSISFGDPKFNESRYAQLMADQLGTNHHVENVDADDFSLVEKVAEIYDEPFADSSAIPTYRVCELARKHVTVALSGDGGDEVFAGYRRYRWHMNEEKIRRLIPGALRRTVFGLAGSIYPKMDWAPRVFRAKSTLQAIARDTVDAYLHSVSILPNNLHGKLFSESFTRSLQGYGAREVFQKHLESCDTDDQLSLVQYLDMKTYLPGDILTKVDRASMAHSLEVRVPILDADFAAWVCSLPSDVKLRGGEGKYIFKKALDGRVPDDILYRPKMGFAVPLASWFRGPLRQSIHDRLLRGSLADAEIFDTDFVRTLLQQHCSGARDYSPPIWALLVFERFCRTNGLD